jgi:hypothetical protein
MPRPTDMMLRLATLGAETRIHQIREEMQEIHREFPELGSGVNALANRAAAPRRQRRRRRTMSAAQRRAVSARMKKYWAARRSARK